MDFWGIVGRGLLDRTTTWTQTRAKELVTKVILGLGTFWLFNSEECFSSMYCGGTLTAQSLAPCTHPLCHSREFEHVDSLVIHGGTLVDVDDHTGFASTTEKSLQVVGQLAFPEGNMLQQPGAGNKNIIK